MALLVSGTVAAVAFSIGTCASACGDPAAAAWRLRVVIAAVWFFFAVVLLVKAWSVRRTPMDEVADSLVALIGIPVALAVSVLVMQASVARRAPPRPGMTSAAHE